MPKKAGLEYEAQQPAFLRRLRAGQSELDGRHNVQIPRARGGMGKNSRLDMHGEEGDDDPVMIDEDGNVVSREDVKKLEENTNDKSVDVSDRPEAEGDHGGENNDQPDRSAKDENVSSGFSKKRKAVRVVGNDNEARNLEQDNDNNDTMPTKSLKQSTKDLEGAVSKQRDEAKKETADATTVKKGKRKKVKLSFDEPE